MAEDAAATAIGSASTSAVRDRKRRAIFTLQYTTGEARGVPAGMLAPDAQEVFDVTARSAPPARSSHPETNPGKAARWRRTPAG